MGCAWDRSIRPRFTHLHTRSGASFHIPHGLSNAALLPFVMDFDLRWCSGDDTARWRGIGC